jgi:hypothetical protein
MSAEVMGYTVMAGTGDEPQLINAEVGRFFAVPNAGFEAMLWSLADEMKSYLEGYLGTTPAINGSVIRHEKEDVVLTHP